MVGRLEEGGRRVTGLWQVRYSLRPAGTADAHGGKGSAGEELADQTRVDDVRAGTASPGPSPGFQLGGIPRAAPRKAPGHRERSLPLAASISWTPSGAVTPAEPTYPVFITQDALTVVQAHLRTPQGVPGGGFLAGELLRCPETGRTYVVIQSAIRMPWPVVGDDTKRLLAQGWELAEDEARAERQHLVGWYHCHAGAETALSAADADAHLTFFDRPWNVALVVALGGGVAGGVFCRSGSPQWHHEPVSFYELSDGGPFPPNVPQRSVVSWVNYRTDATVVAAADAGAHARALPSVLLFPDEFGPEAARIPWRQQAWVQRARRYGKYSLFGVLPAVGLAFYLARGPAAPRRPLASESAVPIVLPDRLDRLADTVALATAAYDLRARLFASRRMACPELARGLVDVEEHWMTYSLARRDAAAVMDAARSARDQALDAQVDAVEHQFERSPCPRP